MDPSMRLLIIEDNSELGFEIKKALGSEYVVDVALNGCEGSYYLQINSYDLILIDIGLPDANCSDLCQKVRQRDSKIGLIILTCDCNEWSKLSSFNSGADDYIIKPFSYAELFVRIRSVLKRCQNLNHSQIIKTGNIKINTLDKTVFHRKSKLILRKKEYQILEHLVLHKGKVLTRDSLLHSIWEKDYDHFSNLVDVHIANLRKKIDRPFNTHLIKTVPGFGYRIDGDK